MAGTERNGPEEVVVSIAARLVQQFREVSETVVDLVEWVLTWLTELGAIPMMNDEDGDRAGASDYRTVASKPRLRGDGAYPCRAADDPADGHGADALGGAHAG